MSELKITQEELEDCRAWMNKTSNKEQLEQVTGLTEPYNLAGKVIKSSYELYDNFNNLCGISISFEDGDSIYVRGAFPTIDYFKGQ